MKTSGRLPSDTTERNCLQAPQCTRNGVTVRFVPMATANPAKRILVVASDEPVAEIVPAMLRAASYECEGIWEHKAILRVLKRIENYDLLFCQVSALEKEEKLLASVLGPGRDIPLVACAARSREQVPKAIYERCAFLQVPFEQQQLVTLVRAAIEHHDQVAMCYDVRAYVVNTLCCLDLLQEKSKPKSTIQKAITGASKNAKAAAEAVEKLLNSLSPRTRTS